MAIEKNIAKIYFNTCDMNAFSVYEVWRYINSFPSQTMTVYRNTLITVCVHVCVCLGTLYNLSHINYTRLRH